MFSIHAVSLIVATFISKAKWQIFEGGKDLSARWSGSYYFWYVKTHHKEYSQNVMSGLRGYLSVNITFTNTVLYYGNIYGSPSGVIHF